MLQTYKQYKEADSNDERDLYREELRKMFNRQTGRSVNSFDFALYIEDLFDDDPVDTEELVETLERHIRAVRGW
jgi:hypothetical protein